MDGGGSEGVGNEAEELEISLNGPSQPGEPRGKILRIFSRSNGVINAMHGLTITIWGIQLTAMKINMLMMMAMDQ